MATTTFLSPQTPRSSDRRRLSPSDKRSSFESDQPLASSPLMRDTLTPQNNLLSSNRSSRISSARISRDLENWRASLALSAAGTEFEDDGEDELFEETAAPKPAKEEAANEVEVRPRTEVDDSSYTSQQLDSILSSAREQLSVLEGRVKGARYSLADMPSPLASYSPTSSASSPIKATHSRAQSGEENTRLKLSPRINFGAPRTNSSFSTTRERTTSARHARNYSETSVPSPQGQITRGSVSSQPMPRPDAVNRLSLREPSYRVSRPMSSLDPVVEEAASPRAAGTDILETDSKRSSQLLDLRKEAEQVRNRLSLIHDGVHSAVDKRSSWSDGPASLRPEEAKRIHEVQQLERLLNRQEQMLEALDQPVKYDETQDGGQDEWSEIKQKNLYSNRSFQDLTDEDDVDSEVETEYHSVQDEFVDTEFEPDFEESHEDRPDAFDYEHFIIHSVLNTAKLQNSRSRSSSSASTASVSTPRGPNGGVEEDGSRDLTDLEHSNHSTATFETARSYVDMSDSDSDEDQEEQTSEDERDLLNGSGTWPVPPSAVNSRPASAFAAPLLASSAPSHPAPDPVINGTSANGSSRTKGARPASLVYAAVVDPLAGGVEVPEDDETLIRSLAEAMRHACKELQRSVYESARADDWRYRLEEARRLLSGESDIF